MLWSKVTYCTEKCCIEELHVWARAARGVSLENRELKDGSRKTSTLLPSLDTQGCWEMKFASMNDCNVSTAYIKSYMLDEYWIFLRHCSCHTEILRGHVPMLDMTWDFLYPDCLHHHRQLTCLPAKLSVECVPQQGLTFDIVCAFKAHIRGHMFVYNMCVCSVLWQKDPVFWTSRPTHKHTRVHTCIHTPIHTHTHTLSNTRQALYDTSILLYQVLYSVDSCR